MSNTSHFQVNLFSPDCVYLSNLTVPSLFELCQTPSFNFLICSENSFWSRYYFSRFNKPFNPTKKFSTPKDFFIKVYDEYQSNMKNKKYYNRGLRWMAKYGLKGELEDFLRLGADNYIGAMGHAAGGGHMDIVKLMLPLGTNNYNVAMGNAAEGGHMDPSRKRWAAATLATCEVNVIIGCQFL